jgi:phosphate transport system substrate-binding protein
MKPTLVLAGLLCAALAAPLGAAVPGAAAPYRADRTDPRVIRIWGDPGLADLAGIWEAAYVRRHPEIRFENRLVSTAMAMPGLYTGIADLAFLGREPDVEDHDGFVHVRAYEPLRLEIATGSLASPGKSPALAVLVRAGNPLARLTLAQLDALFGSERRRGGPPVRTWGDLGLGGAWAGRPIHLYTYDVTSGTGQYFLSAVLRGSHKLNWSRVTELADRARPDGTVEPADARILAALRADPDGLAVGSLAGADRGVRPVALASRAGGPFVLPTPRTLADRSYPLTRIALAFVNRLPGSALNPKVRSFLEYIYSPAGQQAIGAEGAFLPLAPPTLREQQRQLE